MTLEEEMEMLELEEAAKLQTAPPATSATMDVLKGAGSGVLKGLAGIPDLPFTIASGVTQLADAVLPQSIVDESQRQRAIALQGGTAFDAAVARGEPFAEMMDTATGGANRFVPQTELGQSAQNIGEFVPGILAPGKLATNMAITGGMALGSEATRKATEGTQFETVGKVLGAVAGGLTAAKVSGVRWTQTKKTMQMLKDSKTVDPNAMRDSIDAARQVLYDAELLYPARGYQRVVRELSPVIGEKSIYMHDPVVNKVYKNLTNQFFKGDPPFSFLEKQIDDIDNMIAKGNLPESTMKALDGVREKLDNYQWNELTRLNGDPKITGISNDGLRDVLVNLRDQKMRMRKHDRIQTIMNQAEISIDPISSVNRGITKYLQSPEARRTLTDGERTLLQEVRDGKKALDSLDKFGLSKAQRWWNAFKLANMIHNPTSAVSMATAAGTLHRAGAPQRKMRALANVQQAMLNPAFNANLQSRVQKSVDTLPGRQIAGGLTIAGATANDEQ